MLLICCCFCCVLLLLLLFFPFLLFHLFRAFTFYLVFLLVHCSLSSWISIYRIYIYICIYLLDCKRTLYTTNIISLCLCLTFSVFFLYTAILWSLNTVFSFTLYSLFLYCDFCAIAYTCNDTNKKISDWFHAYSGTQ